MRDRSELAYAVVLVAVCGHASTEFFAVLSGVAGPETSVWRFMIGSAGLIATALIFKRSRDLLTPLREQGWRLIWLSLIGITAAYLAFHWALDFATVVQVATLVTTIPIFVGLANLVVNRAPFPVPRMISGTAAMLGIALLVTDGYLAELAGRSGSLYGIALTLSCAALISLYAVLARPLIARYGAIRITTITMTIGAAGLWLVVGFAFGLWVNPLTLFDRPPLASASLLTVGLWNTTATQLLWLGGLAAVPDITRGSYLFFLKPVIAAALALVFLSQPITAIQVAAIAVICGSVMVELLWPRIARRRARSGAHSAGKERPK